MTIQFKRISIIIFAFVLILAMCLTFTVFTKDLFGDYESGSKTYSAQGLPVSGDSLDFTFWFFDVNPMVIEYANSAILTVLVDDVNLPGQIDTVYFIGKDGAQHYLGEVGVYSGVWSFSVDPNWINEGANGVRYVGGDGWWTDVYSARLTIGWNLWLRDRPLICKQVWVNEDNKFQFSFIWPYADNNWVRIYDAAGNMVYEIDMPYENPNIIVDLPDGMYLVKTFHDQPEHIQQFVIGKP